MSTAFVIASLPVGAGHLGLCPLPGRAGGVKADLARIAEFGPALIISLTPTAEMAACGAADLPARLAEAGFDRRHFPIADFAAPAPEDAPAWKPLAATARTTLDAGGKVLIHCNAGRGRSGAVAMRLMVEAGEDPETALARLRAIRPGAVETEAQRNWAEAGCRRRRTP